MNRRDVIIAIGVLGSGALALYWLLSPRPVLVETAPVTHGSFFDIVEEDGRTRVRDRYVVMAPLAGRMSRVGLRAGDAVTTAQTLTTIAPSVPPLIDPRARQELEERVGTFQASLEEAAAVHDRAKVLLAKAQSELERTRQLKARNVVSVAQLERDTFTLQAAERDVVATERRYHATAHALEQARSALRRSDDNGSGDRFPVTSPITGRILRIIQESEGTVGLGMALFEIGDTADLEIAIDVLSTDAARIRAGAKVTIDRWGGTTALQGRVRRVEPSAFTKVSALGVEEQRVWVVVDLVSPRESWASLGDGYRVDASIVVDEIDSATIAPVGALFRRDNAWAVFVMDGSRARLRKVEVARRSGRAAAITAGLASGDAVIVYPPAALTDGAAVRRQ